MQRAVWPVGVVVMREHAKHAREVSASHEQEPVEALRADGADEALGDRVRLWSPHWRLDDLNLYAGENGVEVARELAVAVTDQEAKPRGLLLERPRELAHLLGHPGAGWVGGAASEVEAAAGEFDVG